MSTFGAKFSRFLLGRCCWRRWCRGIHRAKHCRAQISHYSHANTSPIDSKSSCNSFFAITFNLISVDYGRIIIAFILNMANMIRPLGRCLQRPISNIQIPNTVCLRWGLPAFNVKIISQMIFEESALSQNSKNYQIEMLSHLDKHFQKILFAIPCSQKNPVSKQK